MPPLIFLFSESLSLIYQCAQFMIYSEIFLILRRDIRLLGVDNAPFPVFLATPRVHCLLPYHRLLDADPTAVICLKFRSTREMLRSCTSEPVRRQLKFMEAGPGHRLNEWKKETRRRGQKGSKSHGGVRMLPKAMTSEFSMKSFVFFFLCTLFSSRKGLHGEYTGESRCLSATWSAEIELRRRSRSSISYQRHLF